jgi:hypothetical protein
MRAPFYAGPHGWIFDSGEQPVNSCSSFGSDVCGRFSVYTSFVFFKKTIVCIAAD